MEDTNTLAADCIVICCCCQCLALQIVLLLLLKLPWKLVRKTREFAKRRLRMREKEEKMVGKEKGSDYRDKLKGISNGRCMRSEENGLGLSCMEEIEKVMQDLHEKGEFGFGSFWGHGNSISGSCRDEQQYSPTNVQYQLIQVIPST
ncbi:uncharacterized protein LOC120067034 [Benincasa hispida]|uniref:uncharacterized protein LOC120067034 n=1 Tax=Benincasa hispida TaxID=102211 RepID=UPI0019026AFB|nr:uncharacterized protein LOC120067034 [Benincasa hispida]